RTPARCIPAWVSPEDGTHLAGVIGIFGLECGRPGLPPRGAGCPAGGRPLPVREASTAEPPRQRGGPGAGKRLARRTAQTLRPGPARPPARPTSPPPPLVRASLGERMSEG